ncbi:MAG: asparagine synthetase B, partial [Candidatus Omnitrophica bacterium]|nr:asparagine synthetase B [Candidatus Omnitrophota bacterium]
SVVAMMSKLSSSPIKTFSIGFDDPRYNELAYAKRVAEHFGTVHTEFVVKPAMMDVMPELVRRFGEPFADSSCIPTYYVSKLTREHVTVALNGDGADESFAGYDRYLAVVLSEYLTKACAIIPARIWNRVVAALPAHQDQRAFLYRIRRFLSAIKGPFGQRYKRWMSSFSDLDLEQLYLASCHEEIQSAQGSDEVIALLNVSETADVIKLLLGTELQSYLPGDLLVKMDITSMANSLEARSPFLDHTVVEYAWALGSQYKLRGICSKYILKKTFKDILPREILGRKKTGFGVPVRQWFMHELKDYVKEMLLDRDAFGSQYFNCAYIENMVNEHVTGRWNHDRSLWTLVALELWYRHCFKN